MGSGIEPALPVHDAPADGCHRGFTLVELLIILTVVGILALIVVPTYSNLADTGRAEAMATTARYMRELIGYKIAATGYPRTVDPEWFANGHLPYHTWTNRPLVVETVRAGGDAVFPSTKTFDPDAAGAANAWYNASNGAFCVRVPPQQNVGETLETFNTVNACAAGELDQMVR